LVFIPALALFLLNASSLIQLNYRHDWYTTNSSSPRGNAAKKAINYSHPSTSSSWHESYSQLRPLVISGPSGVGKGTLIDMLVKYYNKEVMLDSKMDTLAQQDLDLHHPLGFSVSHTTRNPRPGEKDGVHYHFTTRDEMLKAIAYDEFIEYAQVHGEFYGTAYESVEKVIQEGKICILDIDVQGAMKMKDNELIAMPYFLFIAPPSMKVLETRLRERGTETEDAIRTRLGNAQKEVDFGLQPGNFDEIIVNDDLNESFIHLKMIMENWYPHLNQVASPSYDL
jgi:guanylate kinase